MRTKATSTRARVKTSKGGSSCSRPKKARAIPRTWQSKFLANLRRCPVPTQALVAAGVNPSTGYRLRQKDPAFARAWKEAMRIGIARAESAAWHRATDGWLRPVYQGGAKVGTVREFDTKLLMFVLSARLKRYRQRGDITLTIKDRAKQLALAHGLTEADAAELVEVAERIARGDEKA